MATDLFIKLKGRRTANVPPDAADKQIMDFNNTKREFKDSRAKQIFTSTSFNVKDVVEIILANPDCKQLRVYNAFENGTYRTYMAAEKGGRRFLKAEEETAKSTADAVATAAAPVVKGSCCPCNPCKIQTHKDHH